MPWEERTVEKSREDFIHEVSEGEETISGLCRKYGISRKTGYKWLHRIGTGEGLKDKSRIPFHMPNKTPDEVEEQIIRERQNHPGWGARKLKLVLERKGCCGLPAASTISNILKRNGYIDREESQKHKAYIRFEKEQSNDLWQTDFKGNFGMLNGERCHALTVLDDHSRYSLCVDAKNNERTEGVINSFKRIFSEYGLPREILCDNGNPWGTSQSVGYTKFEVWMMDLDILTVHGRPLHPQTQGKEERFHRTMDVDLLNHIVIRDLTDAQEHFNEFRYTYNKERPHEALGNDVPSKHYEASTRRMPEKIEEWEYPDGEARSIKGSGYLTYRNQGYFISEAFGGKVLCVRESEAEGCVDLIYRNFRIGQLDVNERAVVSRKIYRLNPET